MQRRVQVIRGMALAVALCFSLTLAACVGPTIVTGRATAGPFNVRLKIDPPTMQAGQKATLNFFFTDPANNNAPVTNLALVHERPLQVFVVDRQLAYFKHDESAGVSASNSYPVNILFGHEGTYYMFAEFAPTVTVTDTVTGKKVPKPGDTVVYSSTITFGTAGQVQEEAAPLNEDLRPKNAGGVSIALSTTNDLRAGQPAHFVFNLSELGTPIHTIASYLGGAGHLIILDAEGQHFAHVLAQESTGAGGTESGGGTDLNQTEGMGTGAESGNPSQVNTPAPNGSPVAGLGTATAPPGGGATATLAAATATTNPTPGVHPLPTAPPSTSLGGGTFGPDITFEHEFEEPGLYKLWAQFLYRGQVLTADFVVRVNP
jgi:hypothetical protein